MGRGAPGGSRVGGKDDVGSIAENDFIFFKVVAFLFFFFFLCPPPPLKKFPIKSKLTPGDILWFSHPSQALISLFNTSDNSDQKVI